MRVNEPKRAAHGGQRVSEPKRAAGMQGGRAERGRRPSEHGAEGAERTGANKGCA